MKKHIIGKLALFFVVLLILNSCTQFFSTSLAPWAARDPDTLIPAVTADNVSELIELAEDNPDLSLAILKKIKKAADGANEEDEAALLAAALQAAANATALGPAVLGNAGSIIDALNNSDNAAEAVTKALDSMKNLAEVSDILDDILVPGTSAFSAFLDAASADDLAIAAAIIIASEAKDFIDSEDYLNSFDPSGASLTSKEELAIELAVAAAGKSDLSDRLKDLIAGLGLVDE